MQRVCALMFRRVQFTCVTTRFFSSVRLQSAHPLCKREVIPLSSNLSCHQYATQSNQGIFQRLRNIFGLGKLPKSVSLSLSHTI